METLSRITFQRFFRRYHRLAGMSGTLAEARGELARLYGLRIVRLPPRLPPRRVAGRTLCFATDAARWQAVVHRVAELAARRRPVLVGTDSVEASQQLSAALDRAGVAHVVLNARHDAAEAAIVAQAGEAGRITVSTNMAGRGTDIRLQPEAVAAGGLHVLCCQYNSVRRHDRQLQGRAGRQGEPGGCETWISLESVRRAGRGMASPAWLAWSLEMAGRLRCPGWVLDILLRLHQHGEEIRLSRQRSRLFELDDTVERQLHFCGTHTS